MNLIYQDLYEKLYGKRDCSDVISAIEKFKYKSTMTTVYDIGCGQGRLFEKLSSIFNQYYGVDIDQGALAKFHINYPEAIIADTIDNHWLPADVLIFYFNVLNYFSYDEYIAFFEKLKVKLSKTTFCFYYFLNFDDFLDKSKPISRDVILDDNKYSFSNKIYRNTRMDSYVFEEYIEQDGEIIFNQKNNLFRWNSKELERIHGSMGYNVSILSDTQKTMRNIETIMEISPK